MKKLSYLNDLTCSSCGRSFNPQQLQTYCHECNAPLLANYDLTSLRKQLDRDEIKHRPKGMWRWSEILPIEGRDHIVSLGEGDAPLFRLRNLEERLGFSNLHLKEEGLNPTGTFKARGISAAVSKARELGVNQIVLPSAGNAGGALAAYASRAKIKARIIMPSSSPKANIIESQITGAEVSLIEGLIDEAGRLAQQIERSEGWFNLSTFKEPYRVEGKKTMGYEIAETLAWKLPDVILYPTGGGTGLVGMWKAFHELEALGWLAGDVMPRMVAVQAAGCAPIVRAFHAGKTDCDLWENAQTIAAGLCVPLSFADKLILRYIRESNGTAVAVTDAEITAAQKLLAREEGVFSCPEGAATIAALYVLNQQGLISRDENIVLFNTGSGLKYIC